MVGTYLIRRFFLMLLTLFGISVLVFTMLRVVPGNIADILFDAAGMIDVAEKAKLEHELGLDKPIAVQYAAWIGGLAHGDLGYSYVSEKPAMQEILPRIPITAKLAGLALTVLHPVRRSARRDQRGQAEFHARLCLARHQPERPVDAGVLARPADSDGFRANFSAPFRSTPTRPRASGTRCGCSASRRRRWASAPRRWSCG